MAIKAEYKPPKGLTSYEEARRKRALERKRSLYKERKIKGKPYG